MGKMPAFLTRILPVVTPARPHPRILPNPVSC